MNKAYFSSPGFLVACIVGGTALTYAYIQSGLMWRNWKVYPEYQKKKIDAAIYL